MLLQEDQLSMDLAALHPAVTYPIRDLPSGIPATITDILAIEMPAMQPIDRTIMKMLMLIGRKHIVSITGIENLRHPDPFILVANHNQRLEALLVPVWLAYLRGGKLIHFMADWNFRLIPGISMILRRGQTIPVTTKPAKPKFLNRFKSRFSGEIHGFELAEQYIAEGKSIGIFPEGTINPNPAQLLRGHVGAAKLSLETGAPLIPMGIRFPLHDPSRPIRYSSKMEIEIGAPIIPPQSEHKELFRDSDIRGLHSIMMQHLEHLSQKHWNPFSSRRTQYVSTEKT